MSISRGKYLTAILVLLIVAALAAQPFTPTASLADPIRAGRRPDTPIKLYNGAPVKFTLDQFEPTNGKKRPLPPNPFTAAELMAVAGDKITKHGDVLYINSKTQFSNGYHVVSAPLDDYVKQLNEYEHFLNLYGYTLRDGPLRKASGGLVQQVPSTLGVFVKNSDLGVILKLSDAKGSSSSGPGGIVNKRIEMPKEQRRVKPGEDVYGSLVFGVNPADKGNLNPVIGRAGGRGAVGRPSGRLSVKRIRLASDPLSGNGRYANVLDEGDEPCGEESKEGSGQDQQVGLNPFCPEGEDCGPSGAGTPEKKDTEKVTAPCLPPKEPAITCLYGGTMAPPPWSPISICKGGAAGGWFGASLCMDVFTSNSESDGVMHLYNQGKAQLKAVLFGVPLTILESSSDASYDSDKSPNHGYTPPKITIPLANNKEIESDYSQSFEGPGGVFPIGPVPITITSMLNVKFGLDKSAPPFKQPPTDCSTSGTGQLDMRHQLNAFAGVQLQAGLDVLVAAAGIDAQLDMVNFNFGTRMSSLINPAANEIKLLPSAGFDGTIMAGHIDLFVEVDLLIYSKRWSVELFNFKGYKWPGPGAPGSVPAPGQKLEQVIYSTKAQGQAQ
jgi:hypothetical protein